MNPSVFLKRLGYLCVILDPATQHGAAADKAWSYFPGALCWVTSHKEENKRFNNKHLLYPRYHAKHFLMF